MNAATRNGNGSQTWKSAPPPISAVPEREPAHQVLRALRAAEDPLREQVG